jgi:hypothetical protein
MPVNHVIVFGDSLSDIGRKWKQPALASLVAFLALPWSRPPTILAPEVASFKGGRSLVAFAFRTYRRTT